jgi:hypothetical protein
MALIYKQKTEEGSTMCFVVNDFNTAWIDRRLTTVKFLMAFGDRFGSGLEDSKAKCVEWTYDQLPELHKMMEKGGVLEQMERQCLEKKTTVSIQTEDGSKKIEVLYCNGYGRKIQITGPGGFYSRMPLITFHIFYDKMQRGGYWPQHAQT